jgi:hypothetical protein
MTGAARLARIEVAMMAGRMPATEDARAFVEGLAAWRNGEGNIEECLGLIVRPGARSGQMCVARAKRNILILEAARTFFASEPSTSGKARELHKALSNYDTSAWRFDQAADVCPGKYAGKLQASLWAIMDTWQHVPAERSIRRILDRSGHELAGDGQRISGQAKKPDKTKR